MTKNQKVQAFAWGLGAAVVAVAVIAWGETYAWRLSRLGIYQYFPLLGLMAFSLMWSHYIVGAIRRYFDVGKEVLRNYFEVTAAVVLAAILLHPGLLAWQLWSDGQGLPPGSELKYVEPAARWAVILGFLALSLFLLFELRRVFEKSSWWKYVEYASDGAMVLIFIHGMRLGGALQLEWFRFIWFLYGASLLASIVYIHSRTPKQQLKN